MKRDIKFRAWDTKTHEMLDDVIIDDNCVVELYHNDDGEFITERYEFNCNVHIMQFTGLYDLNENEIYEGDITKSESELYTHFGKVPTGEYDETFREIIWFKDAWGTKVLKSKTMTPLFESSGLVIHSKYCKVVGNIYGNPELINQRKL